MSKPRSHLLDIYSCWLHLATDLDQWRRLRRQVTSLSKRPPSALGSVRHEAEVLPGGGQIQHFVVYIDLKAHETSHLAKVETCAHEAAHVAGLLLDHLEHRYVGEDEPHAYLVGWITQWLWQSVDAA